MQEQELRESTRFSGTMPVMTRRGKGITRDLSSTGIFFETESSFASGQTIEFSIFLEHFDQKGPVYLKCNGSIVRVENSGQKIGVAATIDSYSIEDKIA